MQTTTVGCFGSLYERPLTAISPPMVLMLSGAMSASLLRCQCWAAVADPHLVENLAHRRQRALHVLRIEPADAAHAEGVRDRELAGIDHVAAILQPVVEGLEDEARIARHVEGDDDRRLQLLAQQG